MMHWKSYGAVQETTVRIVSRLSVCMVSAELELPDSELDKEKYQQLIDAYIDGLLILGSMLKLLLFQTHYVAAAYSPRSVRG